MNEQLQKALLEILNKTVSTVSDGIDFLSTQLPDVIHQLLVWKFYESLLSLICFVLVWVASVVISVKATKKIMNHHKENFCSDAGLFMIPIVLWWLIMVPFSFYLFDLTWLQIWLAPKIYLIEYARNFVK